MGDLTKTEQNFIGSLLAIVGAIFWLSMTITDGFFSGDLSVGAMAGRIIALLAIWFFSWAPITWICLEVYASIIGASKRSS
jgi:hypothetical protein